LLPVDQLFQNLTYAYALQWYLGSYHLCRYNATGSLSDFAKVIEEKNDNVATTFGLDNIDVITTFPTDLNKSPAQNDNAGRFGLILSAISQMGEDLETLPLLNLPHLYCSSHAHYLFQNCQLLPVDQLFQNLYYAYALQWYLGGYHLCRL
jgi:hypothetical protein